MAMAWRQSLVLRPLAMMTVMLLLRISEAAPERKAEVGINLGLMGDNLPEATRIVDLLGSLHAGAVRLYDANPVMLNALSNRPHDVIISVENDQLAAIGTSLDAAEAWVQTSVTPFYPSTKITFIAVGNEVLLSGNVELDGQYVIQAMKNIYRALQSRNLHHAIKVISPLSGEVLRNSWPPAAGFFTDLQYVLPLLHFLEETGSTFFINLYPYYAHITNIAGVPLDFASFERNSPFFIDPFSNKTYSNLFESMLDAAYNAMATLGFPDLALAVGETGWPTAGGHAATIPNAELFNKNLIQHVYNKGTPQRPNVRTSVFVFSLFDENQKSGPEYERHWGLLNAGGTPAYPIDLADPGPTVVVEAPTSPLPAEPLVDGTVGNPIEAPSAATDKGKIHVGINLGLMGDHLPDILRTVDLLGNLHAGAVRLYDANPDILSALSNRPHDVIVSVRDDQLAALGQSPDAADAWLQTSVTPFYPATRITFIAVGNEVLLKGRIEIEGQYFIQALKNVHRALVSRNLHHAIKVISPLSGEILGTSWPPAAGSFARLQYVLPLLHFLEETGSTFFINLYPYHAHIANRVTVPLDFASFGKTSPAFVDPFSNKTYTNLFESMLDASYNAMANLGFPNMPLAVGETGWPTAGGHGAMVENAELFNKNLIQHVYNKGTPQRPHVRTSVFVFSLYDENQKPGPEYERHWGLLNANGTPAYPIDLADPTLVVDAPTSPFLAASPFDGAPVNPWISVITPPAGAPVNHWISIIAPPSALDAPYLPGSPAASSAEGTPVNPIDLTEPNPAHMNAPSWPLVAGAPVEADGTPVSLVDQPYVSMSQDGPFLPALPATAPAHSISENPFDSTDPTDGPFLPLQAGASADSSPANPIDLADHRIVLDAPTLPYTAIAPTDVTPMIPIDVSDGNVVMNAPTLPYTATVPTDGTAVDPNDLADRSAALNAPFLPLPATFPGV